MANFSFLTETEFQELTPAQRDVYNAAVRKQWVIMVEEDRRIRAGFHGSYVYSDDPEVVSISYERDYQDAVRDEDYHLINNKQSGGGI